MRKSLVSKIEFEFASKDLFNNFELAKSLNFQNVPEEIIKSISKNMYCSFCYAEFLEFKNVPKQIITGISESILNSYVYALSLNFTNIPNIIITSILKDNKYKYANQLINNVSCDKQLLFLMFSFDKRVIL